jgi:Uma2 family endonuclease
VQPGAPRGVHGSCAWIRALDRLVIELQIDGRLERVYPDGGGGIYPLPPGELMMSVAEPALRRWTVAEYHQAAAAGIFDPEERLELVNGEIYRMRPQKGPHATGSGLAEEALRAILPAGHTLRIQKPLTLGQDGEPEPDIAIVRGSVRDFARQHPTTAALVVEVADSSLSFDRAEKAKQYARAAIPDYWVLNLPERVLEVYRDPDPGNGLYRQITHYSENESVSPLAAPAAAILVRDLLL